MAPYPAATHLYTKSAADLMLDTPLIGAHTILSDAMWSGVPTLTLPLEHMSTRMGISQLTAVGLTDLILDSRKAYEDTLVNLSGL